MVNMKKLLMALLWLILMTACSSQPSKPAPAEKPQPKTPELVTGRTAFQKLYIAARGWAPDAQPYRLESMTTADSKGQNGRAAVWHAFFASPSRRGVRPYIWSGEDASDAPSRGISPGTEDTYSPSNSSTQVFDMQFLKTDSDKALDTAEKHGGEKLMQKDPNTPVNYALDWSRATNELIWHVIYGDRDNPKLRVAVNASSGDFIRVEK